MEEQSADRPAQGTAPTSHDNQPPRPNEPTAETVEPAEPPKPIEPQRPAGEAEGTPPETHLDEIPKAPPEDQEGPGYVPPQEVEFEIVEPPEDEPSEDGFARIPPGPTEEVRYDEETAYRRGRRRRDRGRREAAPAPVAPQKAPTRFPRRAAVAAAIILLLLALLILFWVLKQ